MKKGIFRHIFALAASAVAVSTSAQGITESVTVEGRYTPEVIPADRLPLLPSAIVLTAPESPMTYDRRGVAASFAPDALSMPATGWRSKKAYDTSKGYVDLWLGSWLNSSLSAGYAAINNEDTRLNVWLQHNSTSLWQVWKEDKTTGRPAADKRFRYDETFGGDVSHRFFGIGTITGALQYHLGYFNYYPTITRNLEDDHEMAPDQTLNDIYASVGWKGESYGNFSYSADVDVRHFAYRAMYLPLLHEPAPYRYIQTKGERETGINLGADVRYRLNDGLGNESAVGLGLKYSGLLNSIGNDVNRVEATPAYTLKGRNYNVRLGVNMAVVSNSDKTRFRIAPDINLFARTGMASLSLSLGGGTHLRTLAWLHQMDYYSNPGYGCYNAAYSPLDARLALQLNPGGKWTFGVSGEWRTTLDESFGGLYQAILDNELEAYGTYPASGRIHGFSLGVNAGYEFCRYFALKAKGTWQPQHGSTGILNGFDRPELTADVSASSKPTDRLSVGLDYRLRAKRELLPGNSSRLDLSADYRLTDRISVGFELNNLLNRHEQFLPGLPMEGFNAMGGVQIVF